MDRLKRFMDKYMMHILAFLLILVSSCFVFSNNKMMLLIFIPAIISVFVINIFISKKGMKILKAKILEMRYIVALFVYMKNSLSFDEANKATYEKFYELKLLGKNEKVVLTAKRYMYYIYDFEKVQYPDLGYFDFLFDETLSQLNGLTQLRTYITDFCNNNRVIFALFIFLFGLVSFVIGQDIINSIFYQISFLLLSVFGFICVDIEGYFYIRAYKYVKE